SLLSGTRPPYGRRSQCNIRDSKPKLPADFVDFALEQVNYALRDNIDESIHQRIIVARLRSGLSRSAALKGADTSVINNVHWPFHLLTMASMSGMPSGIPITSGPP